MRTAWLSRGTALVAGLFVVAALAFLQSLDYEKELFSSLCAYAIIALAGLVAVSSWRQETKPDLGCVCATIAFVTYVVIRALASPVAHVARPDLFCALGGLILYGLTITIFSDSGRRILLITALLAFAVVHVVVSVVQFGLGKNYDLLVPSLANVEPSSRGSGFFVDPDHLAGLLEVLGVLGLSITAWSRWPNWSRVCLGYLTAACYLGLVLTGSRGGYISTVTSLVAFGCLSLLTLRRAGTSRLVKFGGIGAAIICLLFAAAWFFVSENSFLQQKLHTITEVDRGRIQLWQAAIEEWQLSPIVGTGSGTYLFYGRQFRSPEMQSDPIDVHNDYLHLLCEYGIIGALGFLIFFGAHIRSGWSAFARLGPRRIAAGSSLRSDRLALNIGALCAVAAYLVHSAVDFNLHIPANALLLAFVFGLLANPGLEIADAPASTSTTRSFLGGLAVLVLVSSIYLLPGEYYAERTRAALYSEDPTAALQFAEHALAHEKKNPNAYFYLGRALLSLGNEESHSAERPALFERALQAFDQARRIAPLDGTYPLEMARTYDRLGRFGEAEKMFELARERDPRSAAVAQLYELHLEVQKKLPNE